MTNAVTVGLTFLESTLSGDATFMGYLTGGLWTGVAPKGTKPEWCTIQPQAMPKTLAATGQVIMTRALFQVKVVGPETDFDSTITVAYDRMLTLIGLVRTTSGILACYQQDDIYVPETVGGVPWVHLGGIFRVEI